MATVYRDAEGARGPHVVAFGGGHGLYASLSALRHLTSNITAVVTVADDGGSSGRLRKEMNVLPPGDLRMALSALCDDGEWGQTWRDVLQHRFATNGPLNGHSAGNFLIVALWELLGDAVDGLDLIGRLLSTRGRVVPMAATPLTISAIVDDDGSEREIIGQVGVASTKHPIKSVEITPAQPPAQPEAIEAISQAEWIIFGPGSWYTSVLPHLMVPQLRTAVENSTARRVLVMNLVADSETLSMSAADYIRSFREYAPEVGLDVILVDTNAIDDWPELHEAATLVGAQVISSRLSMPSDSARHDSLYLAAAYRELFGLFKD